MLGFKHAGMKNRRKIKAEIQVYLANVMTGMFPAASTTFSCILEKIILNSGGQDPAETSMWFQTWRM